MWLNMHRRAVRKPAAALPLFLLARRLAGSLRQDICQTNANAVEAWETLLRRSDKQEENVLSGRSEVYPLVFGVFFYLPSLLLLILASSGAGRIIPPCIALRLTGRSGNIINQQPVLFTSVTLSAPLCRSVTAHRRPLFTILLIPGVGRNSSLPPSFPHFCSLYYFISFLSLVISPRASCCAFDLLKRFPHAVSSVLNLFSY